jgi:glycogen operon protein
MAGISPKLGAHPTPDGTNFAIYSRSADRIELCLFDEVSGRELARLPMIKGDDHIHHIFVDDLKEGAQYGYRAYGAYEPRAGLWFDPAKLLLDPYATQINQPYQHHADLLTHGAETSHLVPKAVVRHARPAPSTTVRFPRGGLIYEICVRPFTMLHPDVPEAQRGTTAALAHPSIIAHLQKLKVDAIELMPITAWIDERHLAALNLSNSWGYNPVGLMSIDPRLAPGGIEELRQTVETLHQAGIAVILDLVFNHSGESDAEGTTLSMRGLDNPTYYRHAKDNSGQLINDTGTGNTIACDHPIVRRLIIDSLRHFVVNAGIDGFRFDLGTILGRTEHGFDRQSETLDAILNDPILQGKVMIAEPWDIGPGGYQLGNFPAPFLEWNDRARDDIRRFWRKDAWMTGRLADAICGSERIFAQHGGAETRSVNFIAAHDGFTLYDLVAHEHKHNEANGESNRDGHNENHSWNNGTEGASDDAGINLRRKRDVKALLATLFISRGAIMLTAGDEGGRTQHGNNNAYCQDNADFWLNWEALDQELVDYTAQLSALRKRFSALMQDPFLTPEDVRWISFSGEDMRSHEWESEAPTAFCMLLNTYDESDHRDTWLAIAINPTDHDQSLATSQNGYVPLDPKDGEPFVIAARSIGFFTA